MKGEEADEERALPRGARHPADYVTVPLHMRSLAVSVRTYERVTKHWTRGRGPNAADGSTDSDSSRTIPLIAFFDVYPVPR